jgi:hypothetical protein
VNCTPVERTSPVPYSDYIHLNLDANLFPPFLTSLIFLPVIQIQNTYSCITTKRLFLTTAALKKRLKKRESSNRIKNERRKQQILSLVSQLHDQTLWRLLNHSVHKKYSSIVAAWWHSNIIRAHNGSIKENIRVKSTKWPLAVYNQ